MPRTHYSAARLRGVLVTTAIFILSLSQISAQEVSRFECSKVKPHVGAIQLTSSSIYQTSPGHSFGFDLKTAPSTFSGGACSSNAPFFFSMTAVDGNYEVTLELGADKAASTTTVRAESRRVMVQQQTVAAGRSHKETFIVNVRSATISPSTNAAAVADSPARIKLKAREIGALDWDDKLTLEFNGAHPSVRSIAIRKVENVPTLYLAGDSTVVDQDKEPWAAWGQMLPRFFTSAVSIANNAESGETIRSFVGENRLAKIMSTIKRGDYLFIQFAHNDQKPGSGFVSIADYKNYLVRYITEAREHGASTILVTSMNRRKFDAQGHIVATLGDYPDAMREVAAEQHMPLIDLNAMSKTLFEAMGEQGTLKAFVHYPANTFPGQDAELKDDTHFNSYGAYELARCIVQSIRDQKLPLAAFLRKDTGQFDPAHPDAVSAWTLPASPMISTDTPYGR